MTRKLSAAFLFLVAMVGAAEAHVGHGATGLLHGFVHPFSGLDHILAMVGIGIFAANIGSRALWAVPLTFVSVMAFGGLLGMAGIQLPFVETGIGLSVLFLGLIVALRWTAPTGAAMAIAAVFAVFHGYAHGAEMPADTSGLVYAAGFLAATATLHAIGIGLGIALARLSSSSLLRAGGVAMAAAGVGLIAGAI